VSTLRLLSYNVRSLRDDQSALARVIRSVEPDVVCVQEAPRLFRWRSACAALARRSGLVVVTGGGIAAGNLILSRIAVEEIATRNVLFSKDARLHQRGSAMARLRLRGVEFVVAGTHLDLVDGPRLRHVDELHAAVTAFAGGIPAVIAGDMNDGPGSPTWTALSATRTDAFAAAGHGDGFTFSAANALRRIDGVFADAQLSVTAATVLSSADVSVASDHRPLLIELELPAP
jgi:endonuclease/exonuclease/phosphatase family metal-dependent hydrolase